MGQALWSPSLSVCLSCMYLINYAQEILNVVDGSASVLFPAYVIIGVPSHSITVRGKAAIELCTM